MRKLIQELALKHAQFETSLNELDHKQYLFTVDQLMKLVSDVITPVATVDKTIPSCEVQYNTSVSDAGLPDGTVLYVLKEDIDV